jgi:hypothetical protein
MQYVISWCVDAMEFFELHLKMILKALWTIGEWGVAEGNDHKKDIDK